MKVKRPVFLLLFFIPLISAGIAAPATAVNGSTNATDSAPQQGQASPPRSDTRESVAPENTGGQADSAKETEAVEIEFRDGTIMYRPNWTDTGAYFTFKSRIPVIVTVVDSKSIESSGSGFANFKNFRVMPGERKTVYMDLESEAGDMSVTISNGKQIAYSSNPRKPIFEEVYRWMVWAGPVVASVEVVFFTILSIGLTRRRLKKDLIQVG